jgi:hypothetical protein
MIIPDVNVLVHAYNRQSLQHDAVRAWWEDTLSHSRPVGLPWISILGFIRICTNPRIALHPMTAAEAAGHVKSWLAAPHVDLLHPGDRHAEIFFGLLENLGLAANLTTDVHLAALAIEYQAELASTDSDFTRFKGLRWINPAG